MTRSLPGIPSVPIVPMGQPPAHPWDGSWDGSNGPTSSPPVRGDEPLGRRDGFERWGMKHVHGVGAEREVTVTLTRRRGGDLTARLTAARGPRHRHHHADRPYPPPAAPHTATAEQALRRRVRHAGRRGPPPHRHSPPSHFGSAWHARGAPMTAVTTPVVCCSVPDCIAPATRRMYVNPGGSTSHASPVCATMTRATHHPEEDR